MKRTTSTAAPVKSVRALTRGLDVLTELDRSRGSSLRDLHVALGLPKPTLLRILKTLAARGFVWRRLADGAYLPSQTRSIGAHRDGLARIAEISSPFLERLSEQVAWPSVLGAPRLNHIEIIETNSPLTGFDRLKLGPVGAKLSYIHTATGRAYLSACDRLERQAILDRIRPPNPPPGSEEAIHRLLDDLAAQGFATRDPPCSWSGINKIEVGRDGRKSIGVAIRIGDQPIASINVTWPEGRTTVECFVERHLETVRQAAADIAREVMKSAAPADGQGQPLADGLRSA
jgi:IclR family mhp operon transcriptional activator